MKRSANALIIGSSGKLTTQIMNGAPYEIFFSADMKYPRTLDEKGFGKGKTRIFGYGVPTLWSMDESIVMDDTGSFLLSENIGKIVIADPKNAPYGEMAINFFKKNQIYEDIKDRLVFGESISQVNEYILNRTAPVGVSATSIILSPKIENKGNYLPLEKDYWVPQGVLELKSRQPDKLKAQFMEFMMSEAGSAILKKYGYEK